MKDIRIDRLDPGAVMLGIRPHSHLGTREGSGRLTEFLDGHGQERDRLLLTHGEQDIVFPCMRGAWPPDTCSARLTKALVSPDIAETQTTTSWPALFVSTTRRATFWMRSTSPTLVPPNF